jgi:hypothetical protein
MNIKEESIRVKYLENNRRHLSKAGWSWGCIVSMDGECRDIFVVNAHRDGGVGNIAELGENIFMRRFLRYLVGQPLRSEG